MAEQKSETPVAVWYFIGATFAGVGPSLFFADVDLWVRLISLAISLALIGAGFVQLRRKTGWGTPRDDGSADGP